MARPRPTLPVLLGRFWQGLNIVSDGCWEWTKSLNPESGYGVMRWDGKTRTIHTISWEVHFGLRPSGLHVLHRCDNRKCGRPDHLFLGTIIDNNRDMFMKGRYYKGAVYTFNGETMHLAAWARRTGLSRDVLAYRLRAG